ncbi:MAG: carboxypeptidase regulatory-like domain-containing protein, partial [Spirochaetales bacterium]|nr:carboxypeptidase regulatory-like domain-containing protein [Spirochaetales bacterium]
MASCKQDVSDGVTCMVNGFVYDVETGLPIEGATVSIGTKKGVTDETGYFVVSGVVSGTYDVGIVADGYLPGTVDELIVNPGFFREVREADLVYYQSEIAANGAGSQSSISTSGVYQITQNGNTVTIRNNDAADPNTIDSIGDAIRYSQTIMAVALRPANGTLTGSVVGASVYNEEDPEFLPIYDIPAGTGIVAYYLPVSFIEDDEHPVDESVLLAMIKNMETTNDVVSFRTTVAADGSFTFTNVPNGLFFIVIDPFKVQGGILPIEVPQTICMREKYDEVLSGFYGRVFTAVASGHGEAGTLMAIVEKVEDTDLELLAVRAVDRSELPIEAARDINMPTGGGLVLYFSKILDTHYEDMFFGFESSDDDGVTWEVIPGTKYYIDNDYDLGLSAVYVWNDYFSKYQTTELNDYLSRINFKVSSYEEDDTLEGTHGVKNVYHMDIVSTNLYGSTFYGNIVNGEFSPTDNIEITFDQEIPQDALIEVELYDSAEEEVYL